MMMATLLMVARAFCPAWVWVMPAALPSVKTQAGETAAIAVVAVVIGHGDPEAVVFAGVLGTHQQALARSVFQHRGRDTGVCIVDLGGDLAEAVFAGIDGDAHRAWLRPR